MTKQQRDTQTMAYYVVKQLKEKGGYIKGYGNLDRVMSADHSPLMNIKTDVTACLSFNKIITREGLIWIYTDKLRDIIFSDQLEIEGAIPDKKKKKHYSFKS